MTCITLTTDFGTQDGFSGIIKGVILGINPAARIADITHAVDPYDIKGAAWVLHNSYRFFPDNSVHLAVVDPGVGTERRGVIIVGHGHMFVGPDNGLFSDVVYGGTGWQVFSIDNPEYFRPEVSTTFHARDIFAPVAAYLSNGVRAERIGQPVGIETLVTFRRAPVARIGRRVVGEVVHIDHFGNLITNIKATDAGDATICVVGDGEREIPIGTTYGSVEPGQAVAYGASHGYIEVGVCQRRADVALGAQRETKVTLE